MEDAEGEDTPAEEKKRIRKKYPKIQTNSQSLVYITISGGLYSFDFYRISSMIDLDHSNTGCLGTTCMWPEKAAMAMLECVTGTKICMVRKKASWLVHREQLCRNCLCSTIENHQDLCLGMQRVCFVNPGREACSDLGLLQFCLHAYHFYLEGKKTSARMI